MLLDHTDQTVNWMNAPLFMAHWKSSRHQSKRAGGASEYALLCVWWSHLGLGSTQSWSLECKTSDGIPWNISIGSTHGPDIVLTSSYFDSQIKSLAIPVFPNKNNGSHLGRIQEVIGDAYFISSGCPIEAHTSRLKTDVQWLSVVLHFLCTSVIVSKQKPGGYDNWDVWNTERPLNMLEIHRFFLDWIRKVTKIDTRPENNLVFHKVFLLQLEYCKPARSSVILAYGELYFPDEDGIFMAPVWEQLNLSVLHCTCSTLFYAELSEWLYACKFHTSYSYEQISYFIKEQIWWYVL